MIMVLTSAGVQTSYKQEPGNRKTLLLRIYTYLDSGDNSELLV